MVDYRSNDSTSTTEDIIHSELENIDGARLIAPSIPCDKLPIYSLGNETDLKSGFKAAIDGAYKLEKPVLDLANQVVYSIDMVRYDFWHENQQKLIDAIDKTSIFATQDSFTSNRIGTYRFMWTFKYADGEHGGYRIEIKEDEVIEDGNEDVVLKCGYGVITKGGNNNHKGFVEFNPNKCEKNGIKFMQMLESMGCMFELNRYDLAIDYPISRNAVRVLRDRRKYEYVISSKGGATEYLGTRNSPGRVKVYDKAGEQGLDIELTRVELTVDAKWDSKKIKEYLPICNDYAAFSGDSQFLAICTMIGDFMTYVDESGKPIMLDFDVIPERYFAILKKNTRYKLKKALKEAKRNIEYDSQCIELCMQRAKSFI